MIEDALTQAVVSHLSSSLPYQVGNRQAPGTVDTRPDQYLIVFTNVDGGEETVNPFNNQDGQITQVIQVSAVARNAPSIDIMTANVRQVMTKVRPPSFPANYYNPDESLAYSETVDVIRQEFVSTLITPNDEETVFRADVRVRWHTNARRN